MYSSKFDIENTSSSIPSKIIDPQTDFKNLSFSDIYKILKLSKNSIHLCLFTLILIGLVIFQFALGLINRDIHLMIDSFHGILNILALSFSLFASIYSKKTSNFRYTYGYSRIETLSSFTNCIFLSFEASFLVFRSIHHTIEEHDTDDHIGETRIISELLILNHVFKIIMNSMGTYTLREYKMFMTPDIMIENQRIRNIPLKSNQMKKDDEIHSFNSNIEKERSSHYQNMHTIYLQFIIALLISLHFIIEVQIEMLTHLKIDLLIAFGILFLTYKMCFRVIILTGKILLQALPVENEEFGHILINRIEEIEEVENVTQVHYWALDVNYWISTIKVRAQKNCNHNALLGEIKSILSKFFYDICIEIE